MNCDRYAGYLKTGGRGPFIGTICPGIRLEWQENLPGYPVTMLKLEPGAFSNIRTWPLHQPLLGLGIETANSCTLTEATLRCPHYSSEVPDDASNWAVNKPIQVDRWTLLFLLRGGRQWWVGGRSADLGSGLTVACCSPVSWVSEPHCTAAAPRSFSREILGPACLFIEYSRNTTRTSATSSL
jgi:hypothetical protein